MTHPRLRFAPSPTGNVHIGNIRAAIFNWLHARHCQGCFLLRVEDTDRERSTPEAIERLFQVMQWLGLDYDEDPLYQSQRQEVHLAAAEQLMAAGRAYRQAKGEGEAIVFRIPLASDQIPELEEAGPVKLDLMSGEPVTVNGGGIDYALPSRKGKPVPQNSCLAGMQDLEIHDAEGELLFRLDDHLESILETGQEFKVEEGAALSFTRRQIVYHDLIKGRLSKPLDSMRDLVIVRSDGSPVFHLANVCDDIYQGITHIVRGDDHVENTYRHLLLFAALDAAPPYYAHLPMIVNSQGKPYSKRDGDAFVGEFQAKGFLPQALFNYLTLLGWSPGDDREKLSRQELIDLFSLERVQHTPAQVDLRKLENLNGQYIAGLPFEDFLALARDYAGACEWSREMNAKLFKQVAELMQSRTKKLTDVASWEYFFVDLPDYDEKVVTKELARPGVIAALSELAGQLGSVQWDAAMLEQAVNALTEKHGIRQGKLNQPLRLAVTGAGVGAGIYETVILLGPEKAVRRLNYAIEKFKSEQTTVYD